MLVLLLMISPWNGLVAGNTIALAAETLQKAPIGCFESDEEVWRFGLGTEFPGAKGEYAQDSSAAKSGVFSGRLSGDFNAGGQYVSIRRTFLPLDMQKLEFWVKTADAASIGLRVKDSTGQVHQQVIALSPTTDWKKVEVFKSNGGTSYLFWRLQDE
ncbi:hypothetical protein [Paenibacillus sp. MBLB4367]|uniref:hypothetical protein n=1 Tax=Paenibacillus sp. MBLB4367 TaxID=3384767 RepID=UPI003907F5C4